MVTAVPEELVGPEVILDEGPLGCRSPLDEGRQVEAKYASKVPLLVHRQEGSDCEDSDGIVASQCRQGLQGLLGEGLGMTETATCSTGRGRKRQRGKLRMGELKLATERD